MASPPQLQKGSKAAIRYIDRSDAATSEERLAAGLKRTGLAAPGAPPATGFLPPQGEAPAPQTMQTTVNGGAGAVAPGSYFNFNGPNLSTNANKMLYGGNTGNPAVGFFGPEGSPPVDATMFDPTQQDSNGNYFPGLPTGPLGPNWNVNGSKAINPYIPGTFTNTPDSQLPFCLPQAKIPPISPQNFLLRYLPGLNSVFSFLGDSFVATFTYYWNLSLGDMESRLGQVIMPRQILTDGIERGYIPGVDFDLEEREYDYNVHDFWNWGYMLLRYKPVMQIQQLNLVFPTGQEILGFPPSWMKPQMLSGQIRLVPPQGALSQIVLGPGGYLVMLIGGMMDSMPGILFADYVAGMWPIPDVLIHAISMQTAINFFTLASDVNAKGQLRTTASLEGVVDETREYTDNAAVLSYAGRIKQYEREINRIVKQWMTWSGSTTRLMVF